MYPLATFGHPDAHTTAESEHTMRSLLADLRYALRQFRKAPVFSLTVLVLLALGVGATTAIFTLFDQVLLRALPVQSPQELVRFRADGPFRGRMSTQGGDTDEYFSYPAYQYLRDNNRVFNGVLATYGGLQVGVGWHGQTNLLQPELVSGNYFEVLGVRPVLGRLLQPSDDAAKNGSPVAVLSYGYWQRHFGAAQNVLGQSLLVNGHLFTVVGVTPPGFRSVVAGNAPDLFFPMMMKPVLTPDWDDLENHKSRWLNIVGRLKPGITRQQAQAAMEPVWHALRVDEAKDQDEQAGNFRERFVSQSHFSLVDGSTGFSPMRDNIATPLKVLMGLAGLVLLMACANVASLLLVRAAGRAREMSIRYALGARRARVLRQLLAEGLMLGIAGGALGIALAQPIAAFLIRRMQGQTPGEMPYSSHPDLRLLAISFAVTVLISLLFSFAPALQFWRPNLGPALKQQTVTAAGSPLLLRRSSVGVQIGLSVLLLAAAGLFIRTLANLKNTSLGFTPGHLIMFGVDPRLAGYASDQTYALDRKILDTLDALPGVRIVGATNNPELVGNDEQNGIEIPGYKPQDPTEMQTETSEVSSGYFRAMGIPLLAGREIVDSDTAGRQPVIVVSQNFAQHFFGSTGNALGRAVTLGRISTSKEQPFTIVGVVGDTKHRDVRQPFARRIFTSYLQRPPAEMTFLVGTSQSPDAALNTVRSAMQRLDPKLALDQLETMDMQFEQSLYQERTIALLATSFGVLAVLMSAIGLYGVLAYATAQRTREIGVRMALGASRFAVARLVIYEVLKLAGVSILIALPVAYGFGRAAKSLLFGVGSADPLTLLAVVALVTLVSACAASIPARRAATLEPMKALRYE